MSRLYFAWIDPEETTHGPEHEVDDERCVSVLIRGAETQFPKCAVEIKNPRIGLLAPGRKRWAAIAIDLGDTNGAQRVFMGRLVGIPEAVTGERIRLHFDARPPDYHAQKRDLAETLNAEGAPYFDPVWLREEERDDPDAALKARSAYWHVDRVTLEVTVSDFTAGEDGTLVIGVDDHKGEPFSFRPGDVPGRRCNVDGTVSWTQEAAGTVNISAEVDGAFGGGKVESYTGEAVQRLWPAVGARIGAGWTVSTTTIERTDGVQVTAFDRLVIAGSAFMHVPKWTFAQTLVLGYEARRTFVETVRFSIISNVQDIYALGTEPGDEDPIRLTLRSRDVGEPIDDVAGTDVDAMPIRDLRRRQYFTTARGKQSLEYLIALGRRELLKNARSVEIECEIPLALGIDISCRMNAQIVDPRLPGGQAIGKVIGYSLWVDGDARTEGCSVTIGCMVGEGGTVLADSGEPSYVEDDVLEDGIQIMTGAVYMPISGEVTYDDYGHITPNDDGVNFFNVTPDQMIEGITLTGTIDEQEDILFGFYPSRAEVYRALNLAHTELCIEFKKMTGGPFETIYDIDVSELQIAKGVDLAAESTP